MAFWDYNNKEHKVEVGGHIAVMVGACWLGFSIAVFLVVWFFWRQTPMDILGHPLRGRPGDDGSLYDRLYWCMAASLPGLLPALWFGLVRAAKDKYQQGEEVARAQAAAQAAALAEAERRRHYLKPQRKPGFEGVTLGSSTGFLNRRGHYASIPQGNPLHLQPADLCKNLVIFGGIGSGKTTRFINPILQQVLGQDCSALIFDIKGDFRREVEYLSAQVGREVHIVGDGGMTLNLFRGCTPEVAASYLKSCFIASGSANGDGAFWAETATNYARNLLSLIKCAKLDYSIAGLADLVFSQARQLEALKAAREREISGDMDKREARVWAVVLDYMTNTVGKWDDKFRGNVLGTCEAVLNPFVGPDLVDAFSVESENGEADLYDLLNKPTVFLVNLPRFKFGANGARFAYLLIKLRFMTMMAERRARSDVNQSRYVSFFCDEYQGIVDSVSDTDFWDKSRSSKCFGILSMQGYSSLVQAVGNPQTAQAIFQNWRQRAVARTEDTATLEMVNRTLGQVDVEITSESENYTQGMSTSKSVSNSMSMQGGSTSESFSVSSSTSESQGSSTSIQKQALFDPNDMRMLDAQFALFMGNLGDKAADDVIEVAPLYVPEPEHANA